MVAGVGFQPGLLILPQEQQQAGPLRRGGTMLARLLPRCQGAESVGSNLVKSSCATQATWL